MRLIRRVIWASVNMPWLYLLYEASANGWGAVATDWLDAYLECETDAQRKAMRERVKHASRNAEQGFPQLLAAGPRL